MELEQSQWVRDSVIAETTGKPITAIQAERHAAAVAPKILPKESAELATKRDQLAKLQSEVDQREAAQLALVQQWEELLERRRELGQQLANGRAHLAELKEFRAVRAAYIQSSLWPVAMAGPLGETIASNYSLVAGGDAAIADFSNWEKSVLKQIETNETALIEFAKKHGITHLLKGMQCTATLN